MAIISITKLDAARRQIDTAIRMLFNEIDPISTHTLANAGYRILRDLCKAFETPGYAEFKGMIRPGMEAKFWGKVNLPANFFKHADKDTHEVLESFNEEANEWLLLLAAIAYTDLGFELTFPMRVLRDVMLLANPSFASPEAREQLALAGLPGNYDPPDRPTMLGIGKAELNRQSR